MTCLQKTHQFLVPEIESETTSIKHTLKALAQAPKRRPFGGVVNKAQLLCLVVERSMGKSKAMCGFVMLLVCFVFCVGIVYLVVVFVLVVFGGFLDPCGQKV